MSITAILLSLFVSVIHFSTEEGNMKSETQKRERLLLL